MDVKKAALSVCLAGALTMGSVASAGNVKIRDKGVLMTKKRSAIAARVEAGELSQKQADSRLAALESRLAAWDGRAVLVGFGVEDQDLSGNSLQSASQVLGRTKSDIRRQVASGTLLGKILTDAGKLDSFKSTYLTRLQARLTQAVTDGERTREQADARYLNVSTYLQSWSGTTELEFDDMPGYMVTRSINIAASLLGRTQADIMNSERNHQLGALLIAGNVLEAYKTQVIAAKTAQLGERLQSGRLTQEAHTRRLEKFTQKIRDWDGTTPCPVGRETEQVAQARAEATAIAAALLSVTEEQVVTLDDAGTLGARLTQANCMADFRTQVISTRQIGLSGDVQAGRLTQTDAVAQLTAYAAEVNAWDGLTGLSFSGV